MDRIYRRNILTQQLSFKYHFLRTIRRVKEGGVFLQLALNGVFLLDNLVGVVLIGYIIQSEWVELLIKLITLYTVTTLHWTQLSLEWVMNVPAGLKLNNPLTEFIALKFIYFLQLWEHFYLIIANFLPSILPSLLLVRYIGVTVVLALAHDFLKFLNLCLISFYIFSKRILLLQLSALQSFWRLFRGRKFNPLRNRVDSCNYDTNQLLLGTLFFTLLLFLLPTTTMFYLIFSSLRSVQFSIQIVLRFFIVLFNNIFVLLARRLQSLVKDENISCLQFELDNSEEDIVNVRCKWNSYHWSLNDIVEILEKVKYEEEDKKMLPHSMTKWIDLSYF